MYIVRLNVINNLLAVAQKPLGHTSKCKDRQSRDVGAAMSLSDLSFQEVLIESAWSEYQERIDFFYLKQLVPLNANLFIADTILNFPFSLFFMPEEYFFFRLVLANAYQASLLTITRVATDTGNRSEAPMTLPRFKNWTLGNLRKEYQDEFQEALKQNRFDKRTNKLFEQAAKLRTARYAHISADYDTAALDGPSFDELKHLRDVLNSLLGLLSFGVERFMLPINYHPEVTYSDGSARRPDIERVLDSYVAKSARLNLPERNPKRWQFARKQMDESQLSTFNKFREKSGLPAA